MARIRSLKPEAFTSETLAGCSVAARWTFAGLWTYVDDDGRGRANAGLIKAAVWPLDEDVSPKQVGQILDELEACRLICRYEVDGKSYLHVVNFTEHQHPNRPLPSKLPACSRRAHGGLTEHAVSPPNNGPGGAAADVPAGTEVKAGAETLKTGRTAKKPAGQSTLTEDSVSIQGASTAKSSSTPPTPLRNEQGEGVGDVGGEGVPPTAGADKPHRRPGTNAGDIVAAYVDGAVVAGLPRPDESLRKRVGKQAGEILGRGQVTFDTLLTAARNAGAVGWNDLAVQLQRDAAKTASNGSGPPREATTTQRVQSALSRAARYEQEEGS